MVSEEQMDVFCDAALGERDWRAAEPGRMSPALGRGLGVGFTGVVSGSDQG